MLLQVLFQTAIVFFKKISTWRLEFNIRMSLYQYAICKIFHKAGERIAFRRPACDVYTRHLSNMP